jgi:hypothetical protein
LDASRSNRTAEMRAMRKMIERTEECFGLKPDWIAADTAYGGANNLVWLTTKRKILPFIPVFDKGDRKDGTFLRSDFTWHKKSDRYVGPGGKEMVHTRRTYSDPARTAPECKAHKYRALKSDCTDCPLKAHAAQNERRARSTARNTRSSKNLPVNAPHQTSIKPSRAAERKSRCSLLISNASLAGPGSDGAAHAASRMRSPSQQSPKTSGNLQNSSQWWQPPAENKSRHQSFNEISAVAKRATPKTMTFSAKLAKTYIPFRTEPRALLIVKSIDNFVGA